jgi:hypothetical protein
MLCENLKPAIWTKCEGLWLNGVLLLHGHTRGAQMLDARSLWQLHFVSWCLELWGDSMIFSNLCTPEQHTYTCCCPNWWNPLATELWGVGTSSM